MKAMVYEAYGDPEVLELREVAKPVPNDDELLIKVHAVSINDWDWGLLQGDLLNRFLYGLLSPRKPILGSDVAGRVEAVGKQAGRFHVGDEVFGDLSGRWGGFAEYVCAPERSLCLKPRAMSFTEAAAIPQAAMLAVQGLRAGGTLRPGQRVLINGAGGGVGTFAFQLAKLQGAEVTGVDSAAKLDRLRAMGFDAVLDYRCEDFTRNGPGYDLILDVKTRRSPFACARALNPGGTYVTVGGSVPRLLQFLIFAPLISMVQRKAMRIVVLKPNADLEQISELFEAGKLKPVMELFEGLGEIPNAMRHFGAGQHQGKVVISLN